MWTFLVKLVDDGSIASGGVNGDDVDDIGQSFDDRDVAPWQINPVEEWNDEEEIWRVSTNLNFAKRAKFFAHC